ncbi:hypothetical protein P153DRAFT_368594 [Dothidotthia symphoricarpi CBS 119687]|uniref:Shugoshin n=1 Tax=Dothidotthia symphoricarpi CBS 119687 TaxID=1392245 RepID=A0A6A6A9E3_9PLEO|nr:uncharacterized protein P153DRAFT_368594 [Dothidotthia symphoricarpi CBS 119687]KAF2127281.1 hypothetical protein P153DRAFT_368594 [Dothidotthia symphoricarpi CBS 119687]
MARLNEPPVAPQPSAETIDVVKRRFLRQNRELAKTNSQQSIRIRSLENDCSRLLAENLSLREQVLRLHNAAESQSSRLSFENIDAVKTQLEAKLQELGGMVAQLGQLKKTGDRSRRKSQQLATRRSAGDRQWRSGLGLQEVENQMLPTIAEGKHYPRRTMGADELEEVLNNPDSQSPDIGPPPVSRFENEEPITFDPSPITQEQADEAVDDGEPALSANLETRKKRRESGPKLNIRRVSVFDSPPEELQEEAAKTARTGSKRKFSVREDEDKPQVKAEPFAFSRRNVSSASETVAINEEPRLSSPERPVLGSKPVNTDPVLSPKKQRSSIQEKSDKLDKPEKPEKKLLPKPRGRVRLNITRTITPPELPMLSMPEPIPTAEINLDSLPPKTPFADDIFSPPSTEPSTSRPENKDTPPPGDLSSADQTGMAGRPGRRARPAVSYKEPSLSTKMRRPDAKLVDAVIDRRTSVEPQTAPSTCGKMDVKREPGEELSWKPVPVAPGRGAEEEMEVGSPLRQKLDRRETNQDSKTASSTESEFRSSTASKAISALINETSIAKRKAAAASALNTASTKATTEPTELISLPKRDSTVKQEEKEKDNLAIFDFTDSSPVEPANPRTRINELAKAARNARRHSSVPTSSTTDDRKTDGALPLLHKRTGSGTVKSTSTTNLAKSTTAARLVGKEKKPGLPASGDNLDSKPNADGVAEDRDEMRAAATSSLRQERAASRRKSMMI